MTTEKYKLPSPYTRPQPPPPKEDVIYHEHLSDLNFNGTTKKDKYGVAIFGIGRAGTIHLTNLVSNRRVKLLYIVDDDKDKLVKIQKHFNLPETSFITSADESKVFRDTNVRYVVCASPTHTHEHIISEALNHNKAVFSEKPVAENIKKSKELFELAKKVNQPFLSAFNRRFDDSYAAVRNRVKEGEVGKVLTVKVVARDSPLPSLDYLRASGGIFHDCIVHDIDQVISILREYPTRVAVIAKRNVPEIAAIDDFDTVGMLLSFDSGSIGLIDISRQCPYGYDQRLEVFGEKGMLKAENRSPVQNLEHFTSEGIDKAPIYFSFASRFKEAYKQEMELFLDVLDGKGKLLVEGKDLLAVSKIATACEESARTGRMVDIKWSREELPTF